MAVPFTVAYLTVTDLLLAPDSLTMKLALTVPVFPSVTAILLMDSFGCVSLSTIVSTAAEGARRLGLPVTFLSGRLTDSLPSETRSVQTGTVKVLLARWPAAQESVPVAVR